MEFPDRVGVMILGECMLFPETLVPLFIFEPRYRTMLAESLETHRFFCLAMQKPGCTRESPSEIAGLGIVRASQLNENGTSNIVVQGLARIRLGKAVQLKPYRAHAFEVIESTISDPSVASGLVDQLLDLVDARLRQGAIQIPLAMMNLLSGLCPNQEELTVSDCLTALRRMPNPGTMADMVAMLLLPYPKNRQLILETPLIEERLMILIRLLTGEVARLQKKSAT